MTTGASHTSIIPCLLRTDRSESVHCVGSLGAQRLATPAGQCPLTRRVCMSASRKAAIPKGPVGATCAGAAALQLKGDLFGVIGLIVAYKS